MEQDKEGKGAGVGAGGSSGSESNSGTGTDQEVEGGRREEAVIVNEIKNILLRGDVECVLFLVVGKNGESIVELLTSDGADLGKILPLIQSVMEQENSDEPVN